MRRMSLYSLALMILPLPFSGCLSHVTDTASDEQPASHAEGDALPPDDFIAYFNGQNKVAVPYEVVDGMVVVEGDIVLGKASGVLAKQSGNIQTTVMAGQANHWPSGRIPYVIETDAARKASVIAAIKDWNSKAAAIWVPKTAQDLDYVAFVNHATVTNSSVGRIGGRQIINIAPWADESSAMHEMGHASGLHHEHSRSDRASNINISSSFKFNSTTNIDFGQIGTAVGAYDHQSLMHYFPGTYYFVWNADCSCWKSTSNVTVNWITMENQPGKPAISRGTTLSAGDIQTLRSLYVTALPYDQATSQSLTTGIGWPIVRPFKSGGLNYILHYNTADGQFRTYPFGSSQGMINNPVEFGTWNAGWTAIEFYVIGNQTYALFYNRNTGSAQFYTMNANGKLGSWIEGQSWNTNWDIARVYRPVGSNQRYMFLYAKGSGLAHIWGMKANGALDLNRNTYSQTLFGYEDFQVMEDVVSDWDLSGTLLTFNSTFLLFHDQHTSTQFLQVLKSNGTLGSWVTTTGVGTGFTQVNAFNRSNRAQVMYYNKSTGQLMVCDIKPLFTGAVADPPLTAAPISAIRNHTTSRNFQVYHFNISPWGSDPKGAERLFMYDPGLKRFWNSNLVPYPSI